MSKQTTTPRPTAAQQRVINRVYAAYPHTKDATRAEVAGLISQLQTLLKGSAYPPEHPLNQDRRKEIEALNDLKNALPNE